jgi:signal transduction histidine kinase
MPAGMTADGAAHAAWRPNVLTWVSAWRALIALEALIAVAAGLAPSASTSFVLILGAWTAVTLFAALVERRGRVVLHRALLSVDLVVCALIMWWAPDATLLALGAAFACSTILAWASLRPVDAFIACGVSAGAYLTAALSGGAVGIVVPASSGIGTCALLVFFALATSGFFTVAHRIGALEIATEISRERGRYRRDLHDRLGQALSGMHFEVQAVHAVGLDDQASTRLASLADGYRDAQRMLQDLFRVGDEPMVGTNVASVIRQEARRIGQQAGAHIDVDVSGDPSRVPPWMRPHIVAIAGESVNNALKNGHAGSIDVSIDVTDTMVVVSVTDDGVGFDNPPGTITEREGHYGLREMAERARILGGEVVIASQPGFGTRVRLQAPLPDHAAEDILERDASMLRGNVWTLVIGLRTILGIVALLQLAVTAISSASVTAGVLALLVALDIGIVAARSTSTRRSLSEYPILGAWYFVAVAAAYAAAIATDVAPAFLLYAPLTLLGIAVVGQRKLTIRLAWFLLGCVMSIALIARALGDMSDAQLEATLIHITDIALIALAAIQGARLLDRLETLQIRVRYQALARLRQGLSGRMRDQLTERLEELERHTRALAENPPTSAEEFSAQTAAIQNESTQLKQRLRDIVHTLADPTPAGRTPINV